VLHLTGIVGQALKEHLLSENTGTLSAEKQTKPDFKFRNQRTHIVGCSMSRWDDSNREDARLRHIPQNVADLKKFLTLLRMLNLRLLPPKGNPGNY
jgi:hypothetical protein